jgi:hypothetical protein
LLLVTLNGPAPTGLILNFFSPTFFRAVGDAIQLALESKNELVIAPYGAVKLSTTVSGPSVVTDLTGHVGLQVHGDLRSRLMLKATASASNVVPSVNFTPARSLILTVLPPSEISVPVARSGITLPPSPSSNSWP